MMLKKVQLLIYHFLDWPWQYYQSNNCLLTEPLKAIQQKISPILLLSWQHYLANYLLSYALACLLMLPFFNQRTLAIILALPLAFLIAFMLNHWAGLRKLKQNELLFLRFLQEIIALLRNGQSLENALLAVKPRFLIAYGKKYIFNQLFSELCQALESGWTLDDLQATLKLIFPNNLAKNYFLLLKDRQALGNQLLKISLQFEQNLLEHKHLEQEIAANAAQQRFEAAILFALPFIILYLLRYGQSDFFRPALNSTLGQSLLVAAFLVICLAALVLFYLFLPQSKKPKAAVKSSEKQLLKKYSIRLATYLLPYLQNILPLFYLETLKKHLQIVAAAADLNNEQHNSLLLDEHQLLLQHFAEKLSLVLLGLLGTICLAYFQLHLALTGLIILPLLLLLHDQELFNKSSRYQTAVMEVFPWDFSLLIMLLANQYSLFNALAKLQNLLSAEDILKLKFYNFWQTALLGEFSLDSFFHWANKLQTVELVNAVAALKNYQANGNVKNLAALETQCRYLFKSALLTQKAKLSKLQTLLIIPMALDLIAVLLITLAPVIPSLSL